MHAMTAGGLVASLLMLVLMGWLGWRGAVPGALLLVSLVAMIGGSFLVARRRWPHRAARFSGGRFQLLPALFLFFGFAAAIIGFGEVGWVGGEAPGQMLTAVALALLATQLAWGPLKHILAGTVNLIAHPRPARFGAAVAVADLHPLDLESERLGVAAIGDFTWNRLASFDACIQCGRCEAACPAFAAGQPLNPKALIQDFVAAMPGFAAEPYSGSPHPPRRRRVAGRSSAWAKAVAAACIATRSGPAPPAAPACANAR